MKACVLAVSVFLLFTGGASAIASTTARPTAADAKQAFGGFLESNYGAPAAYAVAGYWTCPSSQPDGAGLLCLGEIHPGVDWYLVSAEADLSPPNDYTSPHTYITRKTAHAIAWQRHWWPYSRHFILRSHEAQVPGKVSVNSPAYDWGWLAICAHSLKGRRGRCDALDGNDSGLTKFYVFTCSGAKVVKCTNKLGDAMRYKP